MDQATETMANSEVNLRFELIKTWLAEDCDESKGLTGEAILDGMATANDDLFEMPSLAANRDADCADLVGMIIKGDNFVDDDGEGLNGIAFVGPSTSQAGFFVSSLSTLSLSRFSFTHEVGHTLVSFVVFCVRFVIPRLANQMCAVISWNLSLLVMTNRRGQGVP